MQDNVDIEKPRLSVIGLGKLGSPMAAVFAAKGFEVLGLDINEGFVNAINEGRAPVQEPQLREFLDRAEGRLRATLSYDEVVSSSDVSFIIVPTPSGPQRTFTNRYVVEAVEKIGRALQRKTGYHLVVVTSTVMPGSTGNEIRSALERSSHRIVGRDVGLCYSPEFIALGSVIHDLLNPDMLLIGESDSRSGKILETIYRASTESNPEFHRMNLVNAELCKISVNTFVTTKISYANMIGDMCDHLPEADADVVTRAVGADSRIGRKYLKPAIGFGGPCFPRDNKAFAALGRMLGVNCALAEATDQINDHQLRRLMAAVETFVTVGGRVTILGLSYKPHTGVIEESQGVALAGMLFGAGFAVTAFDPLANSAAQSVLGGKVQITATAEEAINDAEAVVVMTPWPQFKKLPWNAGILDGLKRTIIDPWDVVEAASDIRLIRLGTGGWQKACTPRPTEEQGVEV